jgi:hypothetical protein
MKKDCRHHPSEQMTGRELQRVINNDPVKKCLSVESTYTGIALLGIYIVSLVLDIMVALDILPMGVLCLEDLSNAVFKNKGRMNMCCPGCFYDGFELYTPVAEMPDYR